MNFKFRHEERINDSIRKFLLIQKLQYFLELSEEIKEDGHEVSFDEEDKEFHEYKDSDRRYLFLIFKSLTNGLIEQKTINKYENTFNRISKKDDNKISKALSESIGLILNDFRSSLVGIKDEYQIEINDYNIQLIKRNEYNELVKKYVECIWEFRSEPSYNYLSETFFYLKPSDITKKTLKDPNFLNDVMKILKKRLKNKKFKLSEIKKREISVIISGLNDKIKREESKRE